MSDPTVGGAQAHAPPDESLEHDDNPSQAFRPNFVPKLQAEYRALDMRCVPQILLLTFPPSIDRIAATQLLMQ